MTPTLCNPFLSQSFECKLCFLPGNALKMGIWTTKNTHIVKFISLTLFALLV